MRHIILATILTAASATQAHADSFRQNFNGTWRGSLPYLESNCEDADLLGEGAADFGNGFRIMGSRAGIDAKHAPYRLVSLGKRMAVYGFLSRTGDFAAYTRFDATGDGHTAIVTHVTRYRHDSFPGKLCRSVWQGIMVKDRKLRK